MKNHLDKANADIQEGLSGAIQDMYANRHIVEKYGRASRIKLGAMYDVDKAALTIKKPMSTAYETTVRGLSK